MKYALISDIHGNYPALQAVLEDARQQHADKYIFAGDYIMDLPWPNEVVNTIKELDSAIIVRGNKEDYFKNLRCTDESTWIYEQMAPTYWNYRELTPENLEYLISLPKESDIHDENGGIIHIQHVSHIFFGQPRIEPFYSSHMKMKTASMTYEEYRQYARDTVRSEPNAAAKLEKCNWGVNVFGHNHMQWYMQYGDTLHINPGSCGMPSDLQVNAPYTLIEFINGVWVTSERRVSYDVEAAIKALVQSTLYEHADIWSNVIIKCLLVAEDLITLFLRRVESLAKSRGQQINPVSNEIWRLAYKTWAEQF